MLGGGWRDGGREGERSRQVFVLQAFGNKFSRGSDMNAGSFCSCLAFGESKSLKVLQTLGVQFGSRRRDDLASTPL